MTLLNTERANQTIFSWDYRIYSYIKEKIAKQSNINIVDWAKNQLMVKRLASFTFAAIMLPAMIVPAVPQTALNESEKTYSTSVEINTAISTVVVLDKKVSAIMPGESKVNREAREKAEADAKAIAEAKAAADAKAKLAIASARNTVTRENRVYNDPSNFDELYQRASWSVGGLDPRILHAIHQLETGCSGSTGLTNRSGSGAQGPMQFLPSTWRNHAVDGNGDGITDINNVEDAVYTAAAYLKACGYPDIQKALWGYNPSTSYYNRVMSLVHSYGM